MSGSAPMVGPPDGSFAEGAFAHQQSGVLESIDLAQSPTPRALRAYSQASSELGVLAQPEGGAPVLLPQEEKLSPDVLNQKYGIPGNLTFTDPLTEGSAASIYASHIDQIKQRDIEQRAPPGFVSGATRFGAQFAAGFLDPLQLGAAMVPVVPEFELGASVGARLATAGLRGAAAGTAGNLPLVGLQAAMSRSEYSDYTAYDALFDLAHGAALGSGIEILGAGGGAFGRALSQRYRASRAAPAAEADPGIAPSALKTGLGQMEQDNPVEVRPVYDQSNSPNVPEDYGAPSSLQEPGTRGATAFLPENEPKGLTQFLKEDFTVGREGDVNSERRAGGLKDAGGDLDAIIGGSKGRPGLINNESGSSLSEAANRAYEAGYFDHVPDENELLDAIAKDHNRTNPLDAIYSSMDQDQADAYRYARDHNVEVSKMSDETGIPTEGQTPTQFWDQVADHLSQEESQAHVDRLGQEHDEAFGQAEQAAKEWIAYHGTPHEFDQFDTGKIGTGEGAQVYGHGLYFAENRGVADSYRTQLSPVADDALSDAKAALRRSGGDLDAAIEDNRATWKDPTNKYAVQVEGILKHWKTNGVSDEVPPVGHLLTVHIKAKPEEMLDWDKPLDEQSEAIRNLVHDQGLDLPGSATGEQIHDALAGHAGGHTDLGRATAAARLQDAGVKGIRYRDAQSRRLVSEEEVRSLEASLAENRYLLQDPHGVLSEADKADLREHATRLQDRLDTINAPTHNVVVFDHNDVEITHRNGEPVERKPFDPEEFYRGAPHTLEEMEHEWRQAEAANPVLSGEGGGGQPGPSSPDQGAVQGGAGQVASAAESTGRTDPQERSQTLQSALRAAAGRKPPDPTSLAAERSLTEGKPDNLVKQAQQDIEDHTAFFQAADAAGQLTEDVRAELERINGLDKEASDLTAAARQAAACIARGMA